MIKLMRPTYTALLDRAIQAHGGAGVCRTRSGRAWACARCGCDGPDEVHMESIANMTGKWTNTQKRSASK